MRRKVTPADRFRKGLMEAVVEAGLGFSEVVPAGSRGDVADGHGNGG